MNDEKHVINLMLSLAQVNSLIQVLGETPTKLGFYPLALVIQEQTQTQVKSTSNEVS